MNRKEQDMAETLSIEQTFERLDDIIGRLEGEELSMEESFAAYAEGLALVKKCRGSIDEVEKKVLVLEESGEQHEL
ncbi:exodeoxyribonuclease VII small subunit [Lacrimispora sp. NSJ-141]|uniref:Exodeoxyribonuclease 7 small subunit n=1 Tax=Lientehia hominis TaxID=2897778 RepID=A0AAP2RJ86_9FIRM|nr:exodeoxyribonuclease VII small subunit [Lientehia hominis]MCD2492620.1 exodeoxyribonuclease VII small subunit [Lientehia hominis]